MKKPYVLITNDDGIKSPGLLALAEAVEPFCDLLIAAPKNQQTNMGRGALSDNMTGIIDKVELEVNGHTYTAYAVHGSPAQAVAHAYLELSERKIDFCVSGVNYGENLGLAFTCSGTLGACFEADSIGIPSIAFSRVIPMEYQRSDKFTELNLVEEKKHIQKIFKNVVQYGMPKGVRIFNVNFPASSTPATEVRITKQAYMNYGDYINPGERDMNMPHKLGWTLNNQIHKAEKDTDIYAIHFDKVISVTPLQSVMSVECDGCYSTKNQNNVINIYSKLKTK